MTDEEFNRKATERVRQILDNPNGAAHGLRVLLEQTGRSISDLYVMAKAPVDNDAVRRAEAAELAVTLDWATLESVMTFKGYASLSELATALKLQPAVIRGLKRNGFVPRRIMMDAAALPDNPKPTKGTSRRNIARMMEAHRNQPGRYAAYCRVAKEGLEREGADLSYYTCIADLRRAKVKMDDHLALFYTHVFEYEHPEYRGVISARHGGQTRAWEAEWSDAVSEEALAVYRDWQAKQ